MRAFFIILLALVLHGCERKVKVKLKVRSADAGLVQTSTASKR